LHISGNEPITSRIRVKDGDDAQWWKVLAFSENIQAELQGAAGSPDWTDPRQIAKEAALGALTGGVVGGAVPLAGKIVSPFSVAPDRQALVDALSGAGVPVSAGQQVGSDFLRGLEAGGIGAKGFARGQRQAFA
jgi:hypothetical protein